MSGPGSGSPSDDPDRREGAPSHSDSSTDNPITERIPPHNWAEPENWAEEREKRLERMLTEETDGEVDRPSSEDRSEATSPRSDARAPSPEPGSTASEGGRVTIEDDGIVRWFVRTDNGVIVTIRDVLSSVVVVTLIGLILFGLSGVWPPLVAVESGSMEPNMVKGDLIFVADETRYVGDNPTDDTGVVTYYSGINSGHEKFGEAGDVIIFKPGGDDVRTPIIHRAHFWVEEGENWVETKANPEYLGGATSCEQVAPCPAEHDGFVTKGDDNDGYDQAGMGARTDVVKPEWISGKGLFRIPWLGHIRLTVDEFFATTGPSIGAQSGGLAAATIGSTSSASSTPVPLAATGLAGVAVSTLALTGWRRRR